MPLASHGAFSTNWKSGCAGSKRQTRISDTAKVISVVHSAIQRALRCAASSLPRLSIDQQRADHRQEGDDGENGPGCHHWPPTPNMNQVIKPATPISIAKA